jgi:uncharacterized damage-inducible protein DinB
MRRAGSTAALLLALLTVPAVLAAQDAKAQAQSEQSTPPTPTLFAPAAGGIRAEIIRSIEEAQKKLISLAEATPAEKYGWRPAAGVRSTGEVFLHVAGGNYFLPTFWGTNPPAGIDLRNIEKNAGDKAQVIATLNKSFDHARQAILAAPEAELNRNIKMFGRDSTLREAFLVVATHAHEHLGQSIAYARMNGITPPWSQGGQ